MSRSTRHAYHFDLDGTLVEVIEPFDRIVADAATEAGATEVSPAAFGEVLMELIHTHSDPLSTAAERSIPGADAETFRDAFIDTEREATEPVSGAKRVLRTLHDNHPVGVITNGIPKLQREKLDRTGLDEYVDDVVISGDIGVGKPDPGIYRLAADRLPATSRTFVADDYERDLRPAAALGWDTVCVGSALPEGGPSRSIESLLD